MNDDSNRDYIHILANGEDEEDEEYCGPRSVGWFFVLSIMCPIAAIFVPCCPCDKRKRRNNEQIHVVV